jgi:hypothetical protein
MRRGEPGALNLFSGIVWFYNIRDFGGFRRRTDARFINHTYVVF